jgi:hypothetical protein
MSKFKEGETIQIKDSTKRAVIKAVYEASFWGMETPEYAIEYCDGSGAGHVSEAICERVEHLYYGPRCECGLDSIRSGGKHSDHCPLGGMEIKDAVSSKLGVD